MLIDTQNLVSLTEANQNFSRVTRLVDERGAVLILRNNVPRYVVLDFAELDADSGEEMDATVAEAGRRLIAKHRAALEELAK